LVLDLGDSAILSPVDVVGSVDGLVNLVVLGSGVFLVSEDLLVFSMSPVGELVEANGEGVSILGVDLGINFSLFVEEILSELVFFHSSVVLSVLGNVLCELGALNEETGGWGLE
jgi:hypothetical protein